MGKACYVLGDWLSDWKSVLPDWDTSEWAAVAAAAFTALAATAAWLSVRAALAVQRAARVPFVSGGIIHGSPSGKLSATFANAGPTLAVQVMYLAVGPNWKHGGIVGDGHLKVGEKVTIDLAYVAGSADRVYLVWGWRDLNDNVFVRNDEWRTKQFSRRRWLRREETTLAAMFRELYPKVPIPETTTIPRRGTVTDDEST
jgi:hypothetical protein